jgi:cation diffusion facilitator CzcD-associated flavoprotein CzcO
MSDTESYVYRFSWDKEDLETYPWKEHYVKQPEVLAYLKHTVDKHDLRKDMRFNTQMMGANWNDAERRWLIKTSGGQTISARYLITSLGLLSKQNYPEIPGIHDFQGDVRGLHVLLC